MGITLAVEEAVGDEKPAFIVYAPLSMTSVREGGTGPDDLVRLGAIARIVFVCCYDFAQRMLNPVYIPGGKKAKVEVLAAALADFEIMVGA